MNLLREIVAASSEFAECKHIKEFDLVGSAVYHPEPKDIDFLVLIEDEDVLSAARYLPGMQSWTTKTGEYDDEDGKWGSFRAGNINVILTVDKGWYDRAKLANEVCHALKLMDKGDRIVVYRVIRDGYTAEQANSRRDGSK